MIAIKDFGMPSCCMNCEMQIDGLSAGYYCAITEEELNDNSTLKHRHPNCPLVEIEPLTDSEQRIFLSAMSREMSICKQIDNDKVDDSTVKKLVPIVSSIKRKVKKALWGCW